MSEFYMGHIAPSKKNAQAIVRLTQADLRQAGLSTELTAGIADPEHTRHVDEQLGKLRMHNRHYRGIFVGSRRHSEALQGFIKFNDWRVADELPYAVGVDSEELQQRLANRQHYLPGRPIGIFALSVDEELPEQIQRHYARTLLELVIAKFPKYQREFRIGVYKNDPLQPVIAECEFRQTGRTGQPIPGVLQELYIRKRLW